jgi:hypothetical protein
MVGAQAQSAYCRLQKAVRQFGTFLFIKKPKKNNVKMQNDRKTTTNEYIEMSQIQMLFAKTYQNEVLI